MKLVQNAVLTCPLERENIPNLNNLTRRAKKKLDCLPIFAHPIIRANQLRQLCYFCIDADIRGSYLTGGLSWSSLFTIRSSRWLYQPLAHSWLITLASLALPKRVSRLSHRRFSSIYTIFLPNISKRFVNTHKMNRYVFVFRSLFFQDRIDDVRMFTNSDAKPFDHQLFVLLSVTMNCREFFDTNNMHLVSAQLLWFFFLYSFLLSSASIHSRWQTAAMSLVSFLLLLLPFSLFSRKKA